MLAGCMMYGFPYVGDMAVVIDQGSPSSRKQLVAGCILIGTCSREILQVLINIQQNDKSTQGCILFY